MGGGGGGEGGGAEGEGEFLGEDRPREVVPGKRSVARGGNAGKPVVLSSCAGEFLGENRPREVVPGRRSVVRGSSDKARSAGSTKRGGGASEQTDSWDRERKASIVREGGVTLRENRARGAGGAVNEEENAGAIDTKGCDCEQRVSKRLAGGWGSVCGFLGSSTGEGGEALGESRTAEQTMSGEEAAARRRGQSSAIVRTVAYCEGRSKRRRERAGGGTIPREAREGRRP